MRLRDLRQMGLTGVGRIRNPYLFCATNIRFPSEFYLPLLYIECLYRIAYLSTVGLPQTPTVSKCAVAEVTSMSRVPTMSVACSGMVININ